MPLYDLLCYDRGVQFSNRVYCTYYKKADKPNVSFIFYVCSPEPARKVSIKEPDLPETDEATVFISFVSTVTGRDTLHIKVDPRSQQAGFPPYRRI